MRVGGFDLSSVWNPRGEERGGQKRGDLIGLLYIQRVMTHYASGDAQRLKFILLIS
jgi:hypothetical protein